MRIDLKHLKKLFVETQSGDDLGVIKDILFDVDSQMIVQYEVGHIVGRNILFSREQVVKITDEKIIVEDSVVTERRTNPLSTTKSSPDPAMMRE